MAKLLVIEDDVLLDEAYRRKFSGKYDLRITAEAEAGLSAVRSWKPDVILLDIYLPGRMDGIDILREIKKDPQSMRIPVLVITNLPDTVSKVTEMGASKVFMKTDVDLDLIEEALEELLAKSEK